MKRRMDRVIGRMRRATARDHLDEMEWNGEYDEKASRIQQH